MSKYNPQDLRGLDFSSVPKHIAIIMDGNRRWAKQHGVLASMGHMRGAEIIGDLMEGAIELGVKTVTLFAFSTENWSRSSSEVNSILDLLEKFLIQKKDPMARDGIHLDSIGDLTRFPLRVIHALDAAKKATEHCDRINLVLGLNYGGRDEIRRAIKKILLDKINPDDLTEERIAAYLDTSIYGDPDLLIRTSGEMRVSNFLLWQISYAEIYCTDVLWPDFTPIELLKAVFEYQKRNRRLGG